MPRDSRLEIPREVREAHMNPFIEPPVIEGDDSDGYTVRYNSNYDSWSGMDDEPEEVMSGCDCEACKQSRKNKKVEKKKPINCACCGEKVEYEKARRFIVGEERVMTCNKCYKEKFVECPACGYHELKDKTIKLKSGKVICRKCKEKRCYHCECCGELDLCRNGYNTVTGNRICGECAQREYKHCERCGNMVRRRNVCYNDDIPYCQRCYNNMFNRIIKSHTYKPNRHEFFKKPEDDTMYLGIELEIESREMDREDLAVELVDYFKRTNSNDRFYIKHDGSVQNGFEIVSHPHTLVCHKDLNWNKMFNWLDNKRCSSYERGRCGLHVHVNKTCFSKLALGKLQYFYWLNRSRIIKFSRRTNESSIDRWARFDEKHPDNLREVRYTGNRYSAINLTNKNTVEFRIFRGTLESQRFWATLEFVESLIRFIKRYQIKTIRKRGEKSWYDYISWLKNRTQYEDLHGYLNKRRLFVEERS